MKIVILDAKTLGDDISFEKLSELGDLLVYPTTEPCDIRDRMKDCDVAVMNKLKPTRADIDNAENLKLICVTATGYDNIDTEYCREKNIGVCNVVGYSTDSVAQLTVALVLELVMHLGTYISFVKSGEYTKSRVANRLTPAFCELAGKKWGIIGMGNIGMRVAGVAQAFGCNVFYTARSDKAIGKRADIDTLMSECDIITVHLPLSEETKGIITKERIRKMKDGAVIVNAARGAVIDEEALAEEIKSGRIYAATDVYSKEPLPKEHCFYDIMNLDNFVLTPHMAWGAIEARNRCIDEIAENIKAYTKGEMRNRVEQG